jgi:Ran GTPase-activating protein (RanGAP) involved in mRNA processing and transport
MQNLATALKENTKLESINLYRNIVDVDGARELGKVLAVNNSLKSIDIGHNRIRKTGLEAIVDGIKANKNSKLETLGIRANFINDDAFNNMFDALVFDRQ